MNNSRSAETLSQQDFNKTMKVPSMI